MSSPWFVIVMLGIAIAGYAWMMPKSGANRGKESGFVSEAAYNQLLEDLEDENRELVDAVAKFKAEQDETVNRLSRRIVDMEHQMKSWSEQALHSPSIGLSKLSPAGSSSSSSAGASTLELPAIPVASSERNHSLSGMTPTDELHLSSAQVKAGAEETAAGEQTIELPPPTLRGRYAELFAMHDKGRSVEQIAKALGLNKGEVQLILQLARREEQLNA
ncbi:hypothetical protein D7Z26_09885 [Cohnella endophytica]|uniref:DUF2802 domain-containing protein n=1 Tax=Cohnella endophytica TaxID=2419778 RepID=A0A494XY22_9BACL|nr:hypothetical protein [Cohnella endophytica]RKP55485.1 hypothetical protein D7Z26_09885 [Cohnella endophytica]